jgi:hypothetical protein
VGEGEADTMRLREQLQQDLQDAMRERDERRKAALRMVLLNVQMAEVEEGDLSDERITSIIQKEVKRREEALHMIREAGREDLAETDAAELEILRAYLPEPLSEEVVEELVQEAIAEVGATTLGDLGSVMQVVMPRVKGRADGRLVNRIVRQQLSS